MATYSLVARKQILGDDARHHPDLLAVLLVRDLLDTGCDQLGLQVTSMQQVLDDLYVQKKGQRGRRLSISSSNLVAIKIAFSSHLCERSPHSQINSVQKEVQPSRLVPGLAAKDDME